MQLSRKQIVTVCVTGLIVKTDGPDVPFRPGGVDKRANGYELVLLPR